MFVIHIRNLDTANRIIEQNLKRNRQARQEAQQLQKTVNSIDNVIEWKFEEPKFVSEDLRQQFLMKTRTRATPTSDRVSPRERVPLATTDFGVSIIYMILKFRLLRLSLTYENPINLKDDSDDGQSDAVPIYTYNPTIGGTQV